ncbi:putative secreted protein [Wickerhamomyces ciferrii]|uniref:1,3-beta-glucanosyltransferase n=1 Tax=Wickerhamomyces ciferrii (strain ATCC 14091 / BCRC 22168 / CBS 111 / JCM 3599 / NBRC 0793 / NRRL Y-1031 F-60-10) TaxID=1206466 RepID=K0KVY9_WICCF|nr:uncharacterized protein BN7_5735 [Wickerhamomyces ciferrii]CCH46147.1 putative secreted protein [Wickerhamomyces ciferrii]
MNFKLLQLVFLTSIFMSFYSKFAHANSDEGTDEDIPSIEVVGNKFFYKNNGTQFYMKGIAYQQDTANSSDSSFIDPLADADACKRDLPYLLELSTNVLRVYAVNTSVDHHECLDLFASHGIYIIADLSEPSTSINRDSPSWDLELYKRYTDVVDALNNYTNVLGFFAGNEVTNNATNSDSAAFVKAAVRDVKAYIKDQGYRDIPVGYSTNDDSDTRVAIADYFACGDDDVKADFYGINMYEWCGNSTFEKSGYEARTEEFKNLSIPLFFSEYGCNEVKPREFTDVGTIYSDKMTDVWSGGIVYMYFQEDNDYGLVKVSGDSVKTLDDFNYLSKELANISPTSAKSSDVSATTISCPSQAASWKASTDLPPTPEESVCECLSDSLSCVVSDDVAKKEYGDLYGSVCGEIDCSGIQANASKGEYGTYSYCDDKTKLSFLLNEYYQQNGKKESACSFDGSASLNSGASTASSCSSVLSAASNSQSVSGSSGSGSSGSSGSGSSSSGGSSSSSSSSSSGSSSGHIVRPSVDSAQLFFMTTALTFFFGGLGFVML